MSIRIDQEGYGELVDAVSSGAETSGALIVQQNSGPVSPWMIGPSATKESYIVSEAMRVAEIPADEIRKIKPMVPQLLFPDPKVAYNREPLTIEGLFEMDRWRPSVRSWTSGTSQPVRKVDMEEDVWSGTLRNASSSVNPMM